MPNKTVLEEKQIWCNNMHCKNDACVRRINTAPFGVVLTVSKFNKDNKAKCDNFLEEWPSIEKPKNEEPKRVRKKTVDKETIPVTKAKKEEKAKDDVKKPKKSVSKANDSKAKTEKPKTQKENAVVEEKKTRAISVKTLVKKVSAGTVDTSSKEFKEMMLRLDPVKVIKYFEDAGWSDVPTRRKNVKVFQFTFSDVCKQVTVPLSKDLRDYKRAMADAICKVASMGKNLSVQQKGSSKETEKKAVTPKRSAKKADSASKTDSTANKKPDNSKKTSTKKKKSEEQQEVVVAEKEKTTRRKKDIIGQLSLF